MAEVRLGQIRIGDAARALRALLEDPEDTAQVFRIIEALSGKNGLHTLARLRRTAAGQKLLRERPQLLPRLFDREALLALPENSLGQAYLRFLDAEGITVEGLRQASLEGRSFKPGELPADLDFLRDRMRDSHDLWHVITGYKGDVIGEASLLAFTFAQVRNPGIGVIASLAFLRGAAPEMRRMIWLGFRRGLKARFFPEQPWEEMLALPLSEVRARLDVDAPPSYQPMRARDWTPARQARTWREPRAAA